MTEHWTGLDDNQLRNRIAATLGQFYWPAVSEVEQLIAGRVSEPSWTLIDTILNGEQAVAA